MKTLFASLLIAFTVGTSSLTFAHSSGNTLPIEASVVVRSGAMKIDVVTQSVGQEQVVIRLRDSSGNTLIKKFVEQSDKPSLSRFDLSKLEDGVYKVEISNGTHKQVKEFTIQSTTPTTAVQRTVSLP